MLIIFFYQYAQRMKIPTFFLLRLERKTLFCFVQSLSDFHTVYEGRKNVVIDEFCRGRDNRFNAGMNYR